MKYCAAWGVREQKLSQPAVAQGGWRGRTGLSPELNAPSKGLLPCRTEQQDAHYDTGISVLCWWAECHCILIKLSQQAEVNLLQLRFGRGLSSGLAGQPGLAHVEGGWRNKKEEISPLLQVLPTLAGLSSHTARPKEKFLVTPGIGAGKWTVVMTSVSGRFTERCHVFILTFLCAQCMNSQRKFSLSFLFLLSPPLMLPHGLLRSFALHGNSKPKQLLPSLLGSCAAKAEGDFCQPPE